MAKVLGFRHRIHRCPVGVSDCGQSRHGDPMTSTVVICPIRYDGEPRSEDHMLWVELRRLLAGSPTHLVGFISVSRRSHWIDEFNPLPSLTGRVDRAS